MQPSPTSIIGRTISRALRDNALRIAGDLGLI
jgi:hypothetical protein